MLLLFFFQSLVPVRWFCLPYTPPKTGFEQPLRAALPGSRTFTGVRSPHSFREHYPVNRPARGVTHVTRCRRRPDTTCPGPAPHRAGSATWQRYQPASASPGPPPISSDPPVQDVALNCHFASADFNWFAKVRQRIRQLF